MRAVRECGSAGVRLLYLRDDAKTANVVPHTNKAYAFYNRLKTTSVNTVTKAYALRPCTALHKVIPVCTKVKNNAQVSNVILYFIATLTHSLITSTPINKSKSKH